MAGSIVNWVGLMLLAAHDFTVAIFEYIFPELPAVGVYLSAVVACLFIVYVFKANVQQAAKIAISVFVVAVFFLYLLHTLLRLFNFSAMF